MAFQQVAVLIALIIAVHCSSICYEDKNGGKGASMNIIQVQKVSLGENKRPAYKKSLNLTAIGYKEHQELKPSDVRTISGFFKSKLNTAQNVPVFENSLDRPHGMRLIWTYNSTIGYNTSTGVAKSRAYCITFDNKMWVATSKNRTTSMKKL